MIRAKRTKQYNITIDKKWSQKFWSFIQENPDKDWDWVSISKNPNITWDIIRENLDKPWNWMCISMNPNITIDIINENIDNPWDWHCISKNPNITMDIINENPEKPWNWTVISFNTFQKEKQLFIEEAYREYLKVYKIQQWWYEITMSPHYKIGCKRINKKYNDLFK